jgi:hypothetical protein
MSQLQKPVKFTRSNGYWIMDSWDWVVSQQKCESEKVLRAMHVFEFPEFDNPPEGFTIFLDEKEWEEKGLIYRRRYWGHKDHSRWINNNIIRD